MKEKTNIKNNKKHLKIIVIMLTIIIFTSLSTLYAKTNGSYATETVDANFVSDVMNNNALASPIGGFLLFIGGLIEWSLGAISQVVSGGGDTVMPWADAILFNAVPILDVNFMNPDPNSIVSQLSSVISSIYNVVLGLAIIFFSFAVMLMAVKLAVSSIAAEKARYKDALSNWALGLVMLFTVHYLISFIFFLNEGMVEVASNIVTTQIKDKSFTLVDNKAKENAEDLINEKDALFEKIFGTGLEGTNLKENYKKDPDFFIGLLGDPDFVKKYLVAGNEFQWSAELLKDWFNGGNDTTADKVGKQNVLRHINELYEFMYYLKPETVEELKNAKNNDERKIIYLRIFSGFEMKKYKGETPNDIKITISSNLWGSTIESLIKNIGIGNILYNGNVYPDSRYYSGTDFTNKFVSLYSEHGPNAKKDGENGSVDGSSTNKFPITMMAEYFRKNSYVVDNPETDIMADDIYLPNAIMYVIFVVQSMLYFFSYLKRLFYVIILAVMAPVIVVFDFFNKI